MSPQKTRSTMPFVHFAENVCGVPFSIPQRAMWRVLADGVDPIDLPDEERREAEIIFGGVERIPESCRSVVALLAGARSGKTRACALRGLHCMLTADVEGIAPGEHLFAIAIARDMKLAGQVLRYVTGAIDAVPALKAIEIGRTATSVTIRRQDGIPATFEILAASAGGGAVRGKSLVFFLEDEACFLRDESTGIVNDVESFDAAESRILPGGQAFIASTPWLPNVGLLWTKCERNFGHPVDAVACKLTTDHARNDDSKASQKIRQIVARVRETDPVRAAREYDVEWVADNAEALFSDDVINQATIEKYSLPYRVRSIQEPIGPTGWRVRDLSRPEPIIKLGLDPAFSSDHFSLAAIASEDGGRTYRVIELDSLIPERGRPLVPSMAAQWVAEHAKRLGVREAMTDQYYIHALADLLRRDRIVLRSTPSGAAGKRELFEGARQMMTEGRLRLPQHSGLLRELRSITKRSLPGGGIQITAPRRGASGHADLVSALCAATHAVAKPKTLIRPFRVVGL